MGTKTEGRFWAKVDKTDGCWEWTAARSENGYGFFRYDGKQGKAHRFSWFLHNGPIPPMAQVNHHCDNPRCVNPDHLYLGTAKQNTQDAVRRNRMAKGKRNGASRARGRQTSGANGRSKLTPEQIARMVADYLRSDLGAAAVGSLYGVTDATVLYHVRRRRGINPKSQRRLSPLQVREVVKRYEAGESAIQLGKEFGVTYGAVYWHVDRSKRDKP